MSAEGNSKGQGSAGNAGETVFPVAVLSSPHLKRAQATDVIMRNVVYALLPVTAFAVYAFGTSALLMIAAATASCVVTEYGVCRLAGKPSTVNDWSAVITGLLLALTLPPSFPLWMAVVGGAVSILLGKTLFGSLGFNIFNPALVGRAFLQAAFPAAITTWTPAFGAGRFTQLIPTTLTAPLMRPAGVSEYVKQVAVDGFSGATPLTLVKFEHTVTGTVKLFAGTVAGSTGETCAVIILLCGLYLIVREMMDWRITAGMLGSVAAFSLLFHVLNPERFPGPMFMLFSGGLMLGAVFMATDMVTSPTTPLGVWIYAVLLGLITVVIRNLGGLPEGVMYAILLGNAVTPILEHLTQPRVFGTKRIWQKS